MLKKFCPRCGKDTSELFDGLCEKCYLESEKILDAPEHVNLLLCACGRSMEKKSWRHNDSMDELIRRVITDNVRVKGDARLEISYPEFEVQGKTAVPVTVSATINFKKKAVTQSRTVQLVIVPQVCDVCSRVSGSYYEAIVQIRGEKYRQKQIFELLQDKVNQYKLNDKFSFITQVNESREGIDVYLGSMRIAKKIADEAKRIYKVETKITDSMSGAKDGRQLSRLTVLIRACD